MCQSGPTLTTVILSEALPSRSEGKAQSKDPCPFRAARTGSRALQHRHVVAWPTQALFWLETDFQPATESSDYSLKPLAFNLRLNLHLNFPTQTNRGPKWATRAELRQTNILRV